MKKIIPLLSALLFQYSILFSQSGIINTVAGNGVAGYSGNGGQATNAEFNIPYSICIDSIGNIFCSDISNNCIREVSTSGIINTIAGDDTAGYSGDGGPATAAKLYQPSGIAIDVFGNLFIADYYNNRIRKVSTTGIISTVAGNGYKEWTNSGGYSGDGGPATDAELAVPSGVAVDKYGNIYIADCENSRIREVIASSGIISTVAGNGSAGYSGDGGQATNAEIYESNDVAIDDSNNIYIADSWNDRVRKVFVSSGIIITIAGNGYGATNSGGFSGDAGPATDAELYSPGNLSFDASNNLFIADSYNNRIREVTPSGIISTVAGDGHGFSGDGGPATDAELDIPWGVANDKLGNIYIADVYNYRIRKVTGITTSISQLSTFNAQLLVFPNPAQNVIYIQVQGKAKAELLELYTITGQKIQTSSFPSPMGEGISFSYTINSSSLSDGIYFLKVQLQDGNTFVKKVEIVR